MENWVDQTAGGQIQYNGGDRETNAFIQIFNPIEITPGSGSDQVLQTELSKLTRTDVMD